MSVRRALWLLPLLVAACATYTPRPLDEDVEAVLRSPDRAVLVREAAERPAPVVLDFTKPLSGEQVAVIAVLASPDLRALRTQAAVADAQAFAAGLLPDPQLSLGIDKHLAPEDPTATTGGSAGLSLDIFGLLAQRAERRAAEARASSVRLDIAWQEWMTAGQARLLARRLAYQEQEARLAHEAAQLAGDALDRALPVATDLRAEELQALRLADADARQRALTAVRELHATHYEFNHLLGLRPEEHLELEAPPDLRPWQKPDAAALFERARAQRLDLAALRRGYDSQEASVQRAVLGQYPRLALTLNAARDTAGVSTAGPAVSLDLPLWNRNRGALAQAGADRDRLRAEYAARMHQLRSDIAALVDALDIDETARATLAQQLALARAAVDRVTAAAARGDVTRSVADAARAAMLDRELALTMLERTCAEQRLGLELAVGAPIVAVEKAQ